MYKLMRRGKSHYFYRGHEIIKANGFWKILKNRQYQTTVQCLDSAVFEVDAALSFLEV